MQKSFGARPVVLIPAAIAALIVVLSIAWLAMESHYRSCVAAAEAKYPAVPVSAFTGRQTGPLKVSFVSQRQQAVGDCSRL
ncbi:MAG: hypothetical protein U0R70_08315 [Solirubrobacteraceae bacterium]